MTFSNFIPMPPRPPNDPPTPSSTLQRDLMEACDQIRVAIATAETVREAFTLYNAIRPLSDELCSLTAAALQRADHLLAEEL